MDGDRATGLGELPRREWPKIKGKALDLKKFLEPGSSSHTRLMEYVSKRIKFSEEKISAFDSRWRIAELKSQAYISLNDYELALKQANQDKGKPPKAVALIVPLTHAINSTIVTYLLQVFSGRRPIFPVGSNKPETAESAQLMEMVLQYNADHSRFLKWLHLFLNDGQTYGVSIFRVMWAEEKRRRTRFLQQPDGSQITTRNMETTYQGNVIESLDPFMFYPDPRVPMMDVARKGEFCFWRAYTGLHQLKKLTALPPEEGGYLYLDAIGKTLPPDTRTNSRVRLAGGESTPGIQGDHRGEMFCREDQGTIEIIPAELGLGESELPEKWQFTIVNDKQIVQAVPFEADHGLHPVAVAEPYATGYGFGQPGMADLIGPIQDLVSWFLNSHVDNVRKTLNDMFVVDPMRIEMEDMRNQEPGKLIRLKMPILGQDMRAAVQQLQVTDVTQQHVKDVQELVRLAQMLAAVNDNTMGLQDDGGRKTATEVRTALEAGASRLSALARIISAQSLVDLREMMCLNIQQYQDQEFWINVTGQDGLNNPAQVKPEMLVGDFNYPVHDGTMPLDKVALLDVWKEIFAVTGQDPELVGKYDRGKMFEFMAELGGARNIESMRIRPDQAIIEQALNGQMVGVGPGALQGAMMGQSPKVNAISGPAPANRMAQQVLPQ